MSDERVNKFYRLNTSDECENKYYSRKAALGEIRTALAKASAAMAYSAGSPQSVYHTLEAVSRLTQLVEDLHDLG